MSRARLFFALWPNDAEAVETADVAKDWLAGLEVRRVPQERLHMTLLFLGSVEQRLTGGLIAAAQNEAVKSNELESFDLKFDKVGCWRRPQVAWLAPSSPPLALMRLAEGLRSAILDTGLALESGVFRPHITLARKVNKAPESAPIAPLHWHINGFGLYQSVTHARGPEYTLVEHFPFAHG